MTCFLFSAKNYSKDRKHGWRLGDRGGWAEPNRGDGRQICVGDALGQGCRDVEYSSLKSTPIADDIGPQLQRAMCRFSVRGGNDMEFYPSREDTGCGCKSLEASRRASAVVLKQRFQGSRQAPGRGIVKNKKFRNTGQALDCGLQMLPS